MSDKTVLPNQAVSHEGWEEYYRVAGSEAWKAEPESSVVELVALVKPDRNTSVLDLGSGDGRNAWPWVATGCQVVCADIASTALTRVATHARQKGWPVPVLVLSDMASLNLAAEQFDVVQCYDALPQIDNPRAAIDESIRLLRPGGHFAFNVFTPKDCAYGEGTQVAKNTFLYKRTLFRFFDESEVRAMLPSNTEVIGLTGRTWLDPPHPPFRPMEHTHDGIFCLLKKC
jgi:ubiquinone/menaquinone biosynthesis C-methylase UbiE